MQDYFRRGDGTGREKGGTATKTQWWTNKPLKINRRWKYLVVIWLFETTIQHLDSMQMRTIACRWPWLIELNMRITEIGHGMSKNELNC